MTSGQQLINDLKRHVADCMRQEPLCEAGGKGLGNKDIEELCGLELRLPSQDHYLTYSVLHALIADGIVEQVRLKESPTRPKYRLKKLP